MKTKYLILVWMCMAVSVSMQAQDKQLVILHTNDTHSTIMPLNANLADKEVAGRGGFIRRLDFLRQQRLQNPDLLYFDSGDFGNHEFDFGMENMARLFKMANFPVVCANYDFAGTPLEGVVKPYVILKRKGVKIGVFGLSPELDGLVEKHNSEGVTYLDPVKKALEVATFLKEKKKCDFIICVSHLGWGTGPANDQAMIAGSRYIDLVLGGHSHTYFTQLEYVKNLDGQQVPVDQNGKHGIWIGKMTVDLKKK